MFFGIVIGGTGIVLAAVNAGLEGLGASAAALVVGYGVGLIVMVPRVRRQRLRGRARSPLQEWGFWYYVALVAGILLLGQILQGLPYPYFQLAFGSLLAVYGGANLSSAREYLRTDIPGHSTVAPKRR